MGGQENYTCKEALKWLKERNKSYKTRKGNNFAPLKVSNKEKKAWEEDRKDHGHRPIVAILSCADARVVPEKIFGAGENEIFVVRIAGNIATAETIASLEYAVGVLNVPLIMAMGHESCGAVEEAAKYILGTGGDLGNDLHRLLSYPVMAISPLALKNAKAWNALPKNKPLKRTFLKPLIDKNTKYAKETLCRTGSFKNIPICTAYYSFKDGVEWLTKCTCDPNCNCKPK